MRIRVTHGLDDLARDAAKIPARARADMRKTMRDAAVTGNTVARDNARRTAGAHGKHYPKAFTWETASYFGYGGGQLLAIWGPDSSRKQGGMSFEHGSRNQPPHLDLARSADLMGPALAGEVSRLPSRWFW
ncbi:hypothetical protein [Nocardioides ochotonae]|uniref:hypothetical protein n=1 Tax=Nocardioides ochotonae TaxID=2685869 RepID=UPI00140907B4|nr:hypothetical protein [Nocardioides ochotonae]